MLTREAYAVYDEMAALDKRFKDDMKKLWQKLTELQSQCDHVWNYNPDPSGNNDSSYTCSKCDKEVRRISK